jgi:carbonic anhydrase
MRFHYNQNYEQLFDNNKKWVQSKLSLDPHYFENLAEGQSPRFLFIGCSDSRVDACEITGTEPGEMFVHRNIANLVHHTDMNLLSVLQYSVEVLKVEHVIVCGHYGCGGVKAAMDGNHHGLIDKWLRGIKDTYRLYRPELDAIQDGDQRHRRLVELSVQEQVYRLCQTAIIQKAWRGQDAKLHVHGWVYDIHDGELHDLEVDLEEFKDMDIYKYNTEEDFV